MAFHEFAYIPLVVRVHPIALSLHLGEAFVLDRPDGKLVIGRTPADLGFLNRLNERSEAGWSKVVDIESAIEKHTERSVLALGASLMIGIQNQDEEENVLAAYRASLRVIRPQLVGAIAEDTDRMLAAAAA